MPLTVTFPLPLSSFGPPPAYAYAGDDLSQASSTTTAFRTGIDARDVFLGQPRCIVCGIRTQSTLCRAHIIPRIEDDTWADLRDRGWIPAGASSVGHEPRNGLLMCSNHHHLFDAYNFFIRFVPEARRFIFVNYANNPDLNLFHNKAVALDLDDRYVPFPSIFILHEVRVCARYPFLPTTIDIPTDIPWQDWVVSDGVWNDSLQSFYREKPLRLPRAGPSRPIEEGSTYASSSSLSRTLDDVVIGNILAATWARPTRKACQIEGTSWTGTGEENKERYL